MVKTDLSLGLALALSAGAALAGEFSIRAELPAGPRVKAVEPPPTPIAPGLAAPVALPDIAVAPLEVPEENAPPTIAPVPGAASPGARIETAPETVEDPESQEQRLDLTFDRRAPADASLFGEPPAPPRESPRSRKHSEVRSLSEPWRTQTQLEKLAQSPRAPGEAFKFTVIGDAEPGRFALWRVLFNLPGVFEHLLRDSIKNGADFTVQLGDMISRGTFKNFIEFFKKLASVGPEKPYLTVIGNHDRRKPHGISDGRLYEALFGKTDYFFDHGGVRFVTVDSSAGRVTADQLRWLDRSLDTPLRKVVFTHMAPSVIKPWGKNGGNKSWGGFKSGSREFADLVSAHGVERVYVGHIHGLRVKDYGGVRYVITGGGGSPLFPGGVRNNFHHYLTVEVTPDGIRETVHKADGTSFSVP